jgi:hypothetical protein
MMYGAARAQETIMKHPNHEHLLKVLRETRSEIMSGKGFDQRPSEMSAEVDTSQSWDSERQSTFPSTPNTQRDGFDNDRMLTDEEINRQSQGGSHRQYARADLATFTPPEQQRPAAIDKPRSAWDALRAKAGEKQQPPAEQKEKDVWGEDK